MNPEVVFSNEDKGWGLAWRYVEIRVCECGGMWDWGSWDLSSSSPCTKQGRYGSREEAVGAAVESARVSCQKRIESPLDANNGPLDVSCAKDFLYWVSLRRQLELF